MNNIELVTFLLSIVVVQENMYLINQTFKYTTDLRNNNTNIASKYKFRFLIVII